jgi:hypothetical protein
MSMRKMSPLTPAVAAKRRALDPRRSSSQGIVGAINTASPRYVNPQLRRAPSFPASVSTNARDGK